jgi:hypothetical protein
MQENVLVLFEASSDPRKAMLIVGAFCLAEAMP